MRRALILTTALMIAGQAQAGGRLDDFMRTGELAAPGFEIVETAGIFWDDRCHRVSYTLDSAATATGVMGPIPLPTLAAEVQTSFDQWNNLKTSYIEMHLDNTAAVPGKRAFDFINEVTWNPTAGAGFLASSPSTYFIEDATIVPGEDIDGDGDSDVYDPDVVGQNVCFDQDSDGDIEFPAGDYKAGTILDNDVQFNDFSVNPAQFPIAWETTPTSTVGANPRASDIQAVAVHEFGHSHGLAHSLLNQISVNDGTGSTMFPFIDIDDRFAELGQRDLHTDDAAWSSFLYQEGTAASGPAALQPGDIAFKKKYDVIRGTLTRDGVGVLGGNVQATTKGTGETLGEAYSGVGRAVEELASGGIFLISNDVADAVVSDEFDMPLPPGVYNLHIQALDGDPAATTNISNVAILGGIYGQHDYAEEFRGSPGQETNNEDDPGTAFQTISSTFTPAIDIKTNDDVVLRNAGAITNIGTAAAIGVPDVKYAERFSRQQVLDLIDQKATLTTALFATFSNDASIVGIYKRALITTGKDNGDGTATINLAKPLQQTTHFVAQDDDYAPYFFDTTNQLTKKVEKALKDPTLDIFVVLEADNNQEVADSGIGSLVQLSALAPTGKSYLSVAGGPFNVRPNNWAIELRFTPKK